MSIKKKYLPHRRVLSDYLAKNGYHAFYNLYIKGVDTYIGPQESIDFIDENKLF